MIGLAEASAALQKLAPKEFLAKVIRTADRWRLIDVDAAEPSQLAGKIFHTLGERELAWDYWTTPIDLHPAESRVRKLSAEIPAQFIAFDMLLWKGEPIHELPLEKRRKELERKAKRFMLSPYSRELKDAERWLAEGREYSTERGLDLWRVYGEAIRARLENSRMEEIFQGGLHEFIDEFIVDSNRLGAAVTEQYLM